MGEYRNMELIKNKRTGKVLLIVEGARYEFNLMKKISVDVLDFTQIMLSCVLMDLGILRE